MHTTLTDYQEKVLRNCFEGKTIYQILGEGGKLEDEYYFYPVWNEKYSLPRVKAGHHTIKKAAFHKLLSEGLILREGDREYVITRKGQEQIMGHDQFTAENYDYSERHRKNNPRRIVYQ